MESITELKCDILLVCETWLTTAKNDVTASISDFGYNIYHVIRKNSSKIREGGVRILYRTNIKPVRLNCGSYSSFEHCALYICCPKTRGGVEDTRLEAKAKDTKKIRGQGQEQPFRGQTFSRPRTGMLEAKAKDTSASALQKKRSS